MPINAKDIYAILDKIDKHCRAIPALNTELRSMLAQVNFPKPDDAYKCKHGCTSFATAERLATHLFNVHGEGELPPLLPHEELA